MPTMKFTRNGSIGGASFSRPSQIVGPYGVSFAPDIPAAVSATIISTASGGVRGVLTFKTPNLFLDGAIVNLFWNDPLGYRKDVILIQVDPLTYNFQGGIGGSVVGAIPTVGLPAMVNGSQVTISNGLSFDPTNMLLGLFAGASVPWMAYFYDINNGFVYGAGSGLPAGSVKTVDMVNNVNNDGSGIIDVNPIGGFGVIKYIRLTHGSLSPASVSAAVLLSNPYP